VQDYCINRLAHERREHFIILCLDNQNRLISEETMSVGTVNQTAVYTREVVILLHNDPSGEVNRHAPILTSHAISKRHWR
jgi:DNA repair protein RadC